MDILFRVYLARPRIHLGFPPASNVRRYRRLCLVAALACLFCLASCSRKSATLRSQAPDPPTSPPAAGTSAQAAAIPATSAQAASTKAAAPADPSVEDSLKAAEAEAAQALLENPPALDSEELAASEDEIALLDELLELSLPDEVPRKLSHEEALLHTRSELPLVLTADVKRLLNYFTTSKRGMATIRASLGRGSAYRPMIERILEEEGVPRELYYLAMAESGFRPKARSHAYATGMWQFISSRGKQYGLRQDRYVDLRYDAETATRAAARHLKDLHVEFGDWYLAMAAYNSGPNRVKSAIRRTGSRDYWTLIRRRALPRETRNYVPIILAMTFVGQNLSLFDLGEIDYAPPLEYDTVRTAGEASFALIADATGYSLDAIKELNQGLLRSATPPYAYDLRLPKGSTEQFEREIALVPADKRLNWRRYEVRPGETLAAVANRYKVKPATLLELNSLPPEAPLQGGQRLTVPTTTRMAIYRYYGGAGGLLEPGTGRYRIASGDTLGGIARRFRTTVANLQQWNGLPNTRIRAGRYLIVDPNAASGSTTATAASGSAPTGRYTVRRGDSLSRIGARVGASVAQLKAWNGIRGTTIHVGQTLKVPGPAPAAPQRASASASIPGRQTPAPSPNHYRIRSGDSLSTIAEQFGVSVSDLRKWNNLRSSRIRAGSFLLVRPSSGTVASARPPTSTSNSRGSSGTNGSGRYTVRRGDTLGGIAERYGTSAARLRAWNGIRGSTIQIGQELIVSQSATTSRPASPSGGATLSGSGTYSVVRGDSLDKIARRHGTTVADLRRWNNLNTSRIYPGQKLVVGSQASLAQTTYRIRSGDSLTIIAKRFGVSVNDLMRWNGLRSSRIMQGDTLVIRQAGS
ncbi:MAG: LysM peptidoglycan-binding domain-containing protein [Bryobacterales bacterium]|nr:LysM peptidoglycan-binding domain-containing protein [Bryobacterales bacterium]MDE0264335.1 LysM peptidoglycan-binding domain-containing protein [Bryobacterales bacterium]MDE0624555.1 LysM peptidoglycan-binding domain-containing protein [Bryobacterales bacterium]